MKLNRLFIFIIVLMFAVPEWMFSAPPRSRSRSSSRSKISKPSKSKSVSRSTSKKATGSRKASASKQKAVNRSATDQKSFEKAKSSGTAYKSKGEATSAFKQKNASSYGSKYASQPTTRPSHIPQSTNVGGASYNVSYNSGYGGYGYMNTMGTWMMYDAMTDAIMLNTLMSSNNYYYDKTPTAVRHTHDNTGTVFLVLFAVVVGIAIVAFIFKN